MKTKKIAAFGELLVRLEAKGYNRLMQSEDVGISYTGAEANVCVSLSIMGKSTEFITRLPDNPVTQVAMARLRMHGVGLSGVVLGGDRMGLYYLERGVSQRPSRIIYDRKHSSFSQSATTDYDWDTLLENVEWLHITGITAALGGNMVQICEEAAKAARRRGVFLSFDPNYRPSLWKSESEAAYVMQRLANYANLLLGSESDATGMLGMSSPEEYRDAAGNLAPEGYTRLAEAVRKRYGCEQVSFTKRISLSASQNNWSAMLYDHGRSYFSREYHIELVDRVGGGDSYAAGLIFALSSGMDKQRAIEYATAAACLKQTLERDFNLCTAEEIERLINSDGSGRICR